MTICPTYLAVDRKKTTSSRSWTSFWNVVPGQTSWQDCSNLLMVGTLAGSLYYSLFYLPALLQQVPSFAIGVLVGGLFASVGTCLFLARCAIVYISRFSERMTDEILDDAGRSGFMTKTFSSMMTNYLMERILRKTKDEATEAPRKNGMEDMFKQEVDNFMQCPVVNEKEDVRTEECDVPVASVSSSSPTKSRVAKRPAFRCEPPIAVKQPPVYNPEPKKWKNLDRMMGQTDPSPVSGDREQSFSEVRRAISPSISTVTLTPCHCGSGKLTGTATIEVPAVDSERAGLNEVDLDDELWIAENQNINSKIPCDGC